MIRYGVSPIAWANDDMPELGGDTPLTSILQDARDIGFEGIELGGKFPRDAATLKPLLARYELDLVGGWCSGNLLVNDADAEIKAIKEHLDLVKAMGCSVFIYAETSNAIHGAKDKSLSASPRLDEQTFRAFCEKMTKLADHVAANGLKFAYHHHLGTVVENPIDLEAFLMSTGKNVGLTLDTGHAALGGVDPIAVIREHPSRIAHVHCKDVRGGVFKKVQTERKSFLAGVVDGMFTVPGDGDLDYAEVMQALRSIGYSGWIIVEAEQDPALANPKEYGALGLKTLKARALEAGLA